jgi:phosphatidylinositol phospholipase C delta
MMDILGSTLYQPDTEEAMTQFPDPELLKGRIIVSTKPPKEYLEAVMMTSAIPPIKELEKKDVLEEQVEELVKDEFEAGWGQEHRGFCHDQAPLPPVDKDDTLVLLLQN